MFRASSAHLQKDTVAHKQHMVLSLSMRVPGGMHVLLNHIAALFLYNFNLMFL